MYNTKRMTRTSLLENIKLELLKRKAFSVDWQNVIRQSATNAEYPIFSIEKQMQVKEKPLLNFVTDSAYKGTWNTLGMHGRGNYYFFYGVNYDGQINDNMLHGTGNLVYPNKGRMEGIWQKGHLISHRYFYPDGLCFGPYCEMPDRRFILERRFGLKAAGRSLQVNSYDSRPIPNGCYDTGDGFYDPVKMYVFDEDDPKKIVRIPTRSEHHWIVKHCRKAWDEPVGYRPDLCENWGIDEINVDDVHDKNEATKTENLIDDFETTDVWKTDFTKSDIDSFSFFSDVN